MLDCKFQAQRLGIVVSDVGKTSVDFWIELFEKLESHFEVGNGNKHTQIESATVWDTLLESNS